MDARRAELVDSLVVGFVTKEQAEEIASEYPEVTMSMVGWIREAATAEDWRRVERLANLRLRQLSQVGRRGKWASAGGSSFTARNWWSWVLLRSKPTRQAAR